MSLNPPVSVPDPSVRVHLALPKGRMERSVLELLSAAGIGIRTEARAYRPLLSLPVFETKLLKPQNIVAMLQEGSRDVGFAGADWVRERGAELIELLDTGLDPVRIVAAAPESLVENGRLRAPRGRALVVCSEYERLARDWMRSIGGEARFVRSYGATEVFPPEDADVIVDNTASGATLAANGLVVVAEVMQSSTRLYANPRALEDARRREPIEALVVCLRAVLAARSRAMVELNVSPQDLARVVEALPCMRQPTVSTLHAGAGYAVRAAVPRRELPLLVPRLQALGAADIVVSGCEQIVP
jgi:ATP phosphoribosyltransferase